MSELLRGRRVMTRLGEAIYGMAPARSGSTTAGVVEVSERARRASETLVMGVLRQGGKESTQTMYAPQHMWVASFAPVRQ